MSLEGIRVLILENDYLIAMDLQRMVEEAGAAEACIVRLEEAGSLDWSSRHAGGAKPGRGPPAHLSPGVSPCGQTGKTGEASFGLAIIDIAHFGEDIPDVAKRLMQIGIPLAFASSYSEYSAGHPAAPHVPVIMKPYGESAVRAVLAQLTHRAPDRRMRPAEADAHCASSAAPA